MAEDPTKNTFDETVMRIVASGIPLHPSIAEVYAKHMHKRSVLETLLLQDAQPGQKPPIR